MQKNNSKFLATKLTVSSLIKRGCTCSVDRQSKGKLQIICSDWIWTVYSGQNPSKKVQSPKPVKMHLCVCIQKAKRTTWFYMVEPTTKVTRFFRIYISIRSRLNSGFNAITSPAISFSQGSAQGYVLTKTRFMSLEATIWTPSLKRDT